MDKYLSKHTGPKIDNAVDLIHDFNARITTLEETKQEKTISTTWLNLKTLRDTAQLIPGCSYRIIDYTTTTTEFNSKSAGHNFDIIVTADSPYSLNENAHAAIHAGDSYFATSATRFKSSSFNSIQVVYRLYVDNEGKTGQSENYFSHGQFFDGIDYKDGVPILYINGTDYNGVRNAYTDYYQYVGRYTFEGQEYDQWQLYENKSAGEYITTGTYILTEIITVITYEEKAKLSAWTIKYCLDNDSHRFLWADTGKGKGVIYYMKDEFNNEAPYDFKNIMFKRYKISAINKTSSFEDFFGGDFNCLHSNLAPLFNMSNLTIDSGTSGYFYTFDGVWNGNNVDMSLYNYLADYSVSFEFNEYWMLNVAHNNKIAPRYKVYSVEDQFGTVLQVLNNIVFLQYDVDSTSDTAYHVFNNTFAQDCGDITIGRYSYNNTFGSSCTENILGLKCISNQFGAECSYDILGCLGTYNTFGTMCTSIRSQANFYCNCLSNRISDVVFGADCSWNSISAENSTLTFGQNCTHNIMNTYCSGIIVPEGSVYNVFDTGVSGISFEKQNIAKVHIHSGIWDKVLTVQGNNSYTTDVYANNSQEVILD